MSKDEQLLHDLLEDCKRGGVRSPEPADNDPLDDELLHQKPKAKPKKKPKREE